jgi:hypothetical protein
MKFINKNNIAIAVMVVGCKAPSVVESASKVAVPKAFGTNTDTPICKYGGETLLIRTYKT